MKRYKTKINTLEIFLSDDKKMIAYQETVASKFKNYFANIAKNLLKGPQENLKTIFTSIYLIQFNSVTKIF